MFSVVPVCEIECTLKVVMYLTRFRLPHRNFQSFYQPAYKLLACTITQNTTDVQKRLSSDNAVPPAPVSKTEDDVDRKLQYIQLEMENLRTYGDRVPELSFLKQEHWNQLLKLETKSARQRYYNVLFDTEQKVKNKKIDKQERVQKGLMLKEHKTKVGNPHITYSLSKTGMFLRIDSKTMNLWRHNRLGQAMQFGPKMIFDCSYEQDMTWQEANSTAKQLLDAFVQNRLDRNPFDLHFCNVNFNGDTFNKLERLMPKLRQPGFPLNLHEGSFLGLFPKEKFVYLTSHCRDDLTAYDSDSIYIIGANVRNHEPLSFSKAKEAGVRMARLPLERYFDWIPSSSKTFRMDQMVKIMLDLKVSRSWNTALRHVEKWRFGNKLIR